VAQPKNRISVTRVEPANLIQSFPPRRPSPAYQYVAVSPSFAEAIAPFPGCWLSAPATAPWRGLDARSDLGGCHAGPATRMLPLSGGYQNGTPFRFQTSMRKPAEVK